MSTEKLKLFARLQATHDLLYSAIEITEGLPATPRTSELLEMLDTVNSRFEQIMENQWWKKEAEV